MTNTVILDKKNFKVKLDTLERTCTRNVVKHRDKHGTPIFKRAVRVIFRLYKQDLEKVKKCSKKQFRILKHLCKYIDITVFNGDKEYNEEELWMTFDDLHYLMKQKHVDHHITALFCESDGVDGCVRVGNGYYKFDYETDCPTRVVDTCFYSFDYNSPQDQEEVDILSEHREHFIDSYNDTLTVYDPDGEVIDMATLLSFDVKPSKIVIINPNKQYSEDNDGSAITPFGLFAMYHLLQTSNKIGNITSMDNINIVEGCQKLEKYFKVNHAPF